MAPQRLRMKLMKKHHNGERQKQVILSELAEILKAEKSVVFAYAHGSFVKKDGFNDIDIGIYLAEGKFQSDDALLKYGLRLAAKVDLALEGYEFVLIFRGIEKSRHRLWMFKHSILLPFPSGSE